MTDEKKDITLREFLELKCCNLDYISIHPIVFCEKANGTVEILNKFGTRGFGYDEAKGGYLEMFEHFPSLLDMNILNIYAEINNVEYDYGLTIELDGSITGNESSKWILCDLPKYDAN